MNEGSDIRIDCTARRIVACRGVDQADLQFLIWQRRITVLRVTTYKFLSVYLISKFIYYLSIIFTVIVSQFFEFY